MCCFIIFHTFPPLDTAGADFQCGIIKPIFARRGRRTSFFVPIIRDRSRSESPECFYLILRALEGESYDPEIRAWTPSRAIGWITEPNGKLERNFNVFLF